MNAASQSTLSLTPDALPSSQEFTFPNNVVGRRYSPDGLDLNVAGVKGAQRSGRKR